MTPTDPTHRTSKAPRKSSRPKKSRRATSRPAGSSPGKSVKAADTKRPAPKPAPEPPPLPFVMINMAMTADGKIANEHGGASSFGSTRDHDHLLELRATADAVMAGARTVDSDKITMGPGAAQYRTKRLAAGLREYNLRIVVSGAGTIDEKAEIFRKKFSPIILLTTERTSRSRLKTLAHIVDHVKVFGCNSLDFIAALRWLRSQWGVNRLLVEGGGDLNFALLKAGLVDELHLTICPWILGGRAAPTIADGLGLERLPKALKLELHSSKQEGEEMFLVYRRPSSSGAHASRRVPAKGKPNSGGPERDEG